MRSWAALLVVGTLLTACGGNEILRTKSAEVPLGMDLSGDWVMTDGSGFSKREVRDLSVHVFMEEGKTLGVTQTAAGLYFSFDRSVVEEYRFGENREISVGAISASRTSGWEGDGYVILTLDDNGAKLTDTYSLQGEGAVLRRTIVITYRNDVMLDLVQIFNRV